MNEKLKHALRAAKSLGWMILHPIQTLNGVLAGGKR